MWIELIKRPRASEHQPTFFRNETFVAEGRTGNEWFPGDIITDLDVLSPHEGQTGSGIIVSVTPIDGQGYFASEIGILWSR